MLGPSRLSNNFFPGGLDNYESIAKEGVCTWHVKHFAHGLVMPPGRGH